MSKYIISLGDDDDDKSEDVNIGEVNNSNQTNQDLFFIFQF